MLTRTAPYSPGLPCPAVTARWTSSRMPAAGGSPSSPLAARHVSRLGWAGGRQGGRVGGMHGGWTDRACGACSLLLPPARPAHAVHPPRCHMPAPACSLQTCREGTMMPSTTHPSTLTCRQVSRARESTPGAASLLGALGNIWNAVPPAPAPHDPADFPPAPPPAPSSACSACLSRAGCSERQRLQLLL